MPKFSIIVPLYNKAPYIRKALESVMSQTYHDFECIVINDGSSDNSLEVVQNFVDGLKIEDRRLKIVDQENAGVAAARNRGVKESRGEYICFLDADDWWEQNYLDEMDKLIQEYPEAGLYGCDYYYVKNGRKKIYPKDADGYIDYCKVYTHCGAMPIHPNGAIIPRKVFDEVGGFDMRIKMGEDFILFMQIEMRYNVVFLNKQLVYFNQDADPAWRAITKLHNPEYHMLWHVSQWEDQEQTNKSYKTMIDWLRVSGLLKYWMNKSYHDAAATELSKVDWSKQPKKIVRQYKAPIWLLKTKTRVMQIGSYCKQKLIRILLRK